MTPNPATPRLRKSRVANKPYTIVYLTDSKAKRGAHIALWATVSSYEPLFKTGTK